MTEILTVSLDAWIVQDGNYVDFKVGERRSFGLEFGQPAPLMQVGTRVPACRHVERNRYAVVGEVVHVAPCWWVLDVGILVFQEASPPSGIHVGMTVEGEIYPAIDPFFYFERLAREAGAPAMIYDWDIEGIQMATAPFIEVAQRVLARDPDRPGWREIEKTDAWQDDDGHAGYLLRCRRRPTPPRSRR